jgi:hypothetical protein
MPILQPQECVFDFPDEGGTSPALKPLSNCYVLHDSGRVIIASQSRLLERNSNASWYDRIGTHGCEHGSPAHARRA